MGVDFGRARIGLAISDELHLLAHPLETITANQESVRRIAEIVRERKIEKIVIGIPKQMSGEIGTAASEALEFVTKLRAQVQCAVETWDERLTTVAANRALTAAGKKTRQTRKFVDQVAAQMILQGYLDRQRNVGTP
jgi:putative holliday junction resolvase